MRQSIRKEDISLRIRILRKNLKDIIIQIYLAYSRRCLRQLDLRDLRSIYHSLLYSGFFIFPVYMLLHAYSQYTP